MGAGALAAPLAGSIVEGVGAYKEGEAENKMAQYNVALDKQKANQITKITQLQQQRVAEAANRHAKSIEAGTATTGVVSTEGSPLMVMAKQASQDELTNLNIGYEGAIKSQEQLSQAEIDKEEGRLAKQRGRMALYGAILQSGNQGAQAFSRYGSGQPATTDPYAGLDKNSGWYSETQY